jgi:hypothetical protein
MPGRRRRCGPRRLWQLREAHTEALAAVGPVVKLDVVVPLDALAMVVEGLPAVVTRTLHRAGGGSPGERVGDGPAVEPEVVVFGHLGVGDLHVNLLGIPDGAVAAVEEAVFATVVAARRPPVRGARRRRAQAALGGARSSGPRP